MSTFRKILGILLVVAGILGLILAIAGLIFTWAVRPVVTQGLDTALTTLGGSIQTSQEAMIITEQALDGTINSISALETMLTSTATSVQDSKPLMAQISGFLSDQMPKTIQAASNSLRAAQRGAEVVDSAIQSFDSFKNVLSGVPFIGGFIPQTPTTPPPASGQALADSLGDVATELENLPQLFTDMSSNLNKADTNLTTVQTSLTTMANNVSTITTSLEQYKAMITSSQSSMENLGDLLFNIQTNLQNIINITALVVTLFLLWLMAAQVAILTQGWDLYHRTTGGAQSESPSPSQTTTEPPASVQEETPVEDQDNAQVETQAAEDTEPVPPENAS